MKKKFISQSAFLSMRVLTGLCVILMGVFLALAGTGVLAQGFAKGRTKDLVITHSNDPLVPVPFDCSNIDKFGIDKQENFRAQAIMIACGRAEGGKRPALSLLASLTQAITKLFLPLYGTTDVDLITGAETYPNVTQSETVSVGNPDNPLQVLVAYNDSRGRNQSPINISGASWSTDGGNTFVRLTGGNGQGPFSGTEGDPAAFYHRTSQTWMTIWLDTGCGGQGIGGFKTTTPGDPGSWTHFCVHTASSDDRDSAWADNNPSSPFYGRLYVSYNDFNVGGGALFARWSSDAGATWTPVQLTTNFIRDVQITGDMAGGGNVYVAAMNEGGGGFPHTNNNLIFRSTDGGNTWTNTYTGPGFPGPGACGSGYFAGMFSDGGCYWSNEGWGEPAAFSNVVHLVYGQHGDGSDAGDVYYIRSTDGGVTFGVPLKLHSDSTTRPQWMPNLSVSPTGTLSATWYDAREFPSCTRGDPAVPCYRMWSRKSNDDGATWSPDAALSDVASPLPAQVDPGIRTTYAGDYDYGSATAAKHVTSWTDGRVAINGTSQQDAFTDRELVGFAVATTNPPCGATTLIQATDFAVDFTDAVDPASVQASDFTVNGTPANSFVLSNGNTRITFHFNSSPVTTQGVQTMHIPAGAITRISDGMGNLDFTCTFCYAVTALQVSSTVPAVGGTFSPPAPGDYSYDVIFNQNIDAASVSTSDLMVSGNVGASVTAVSVNGNTAHFTIHMNFGGTLTASIAAGAVTANSCNGNAAFSGNYTVQGCPPSDHYTISQIGGSIVPGTTDIGNHGDDQVTNVALPFSYTLYDQPYESVNLSSNGNAQFTSADTSYVNQCLAWTNHNYVIFPYWDDLYLKNPTYGIFTSVSGTAPNRIFNIEWRAQYFPGIGNANFELRLYEGQMRFDVIYGTITNGNTSATAGVQKNDNAFDQYFCNGSGNAATGGQSYVLTPCNLVTVTGAVSRMIHDSAGTFDIAMPLTGSSGVECRTTGGTNDYTLVVNFSGNVTVTGTPQAQVTSGEGCVGSGGVCTGNVSVNGPVVTVPLTNIADRQMINVRINGVNSADSPKQPATDFTIPMRFFIGDTNSDGVVNAADIAQTKSRLGQTVDSTNYRSDVNASGSLNSADVSIVKNHRIFVPP